MIPVKSSLPMWLLTLPAVTNPDDPVSANFRDPNEWPGDWQIWRNRYTMLVAANDEAEARTLAAVEDCAIWREPTYAACRPLAALEPSVIMAGGGGAENE